MPIKKKGLGKGLDSLIPDNKSMKSVTSEKTVESKEDAAAKSGVQVMKINEVEPIETSRERILMKMLSLNFRIRLSNLVCYSHCLFEKEKITMRSLRAKEDGELQNLPE